MNDLIWQIAVQAASPSLDARGRAALADAHRAGFPHLTSIRATRIYQVRGDLDKSAAELLLRELFADPVSEIGECSAGIDWPAVAGVFVQVQRQPGVMDPVAISALAAARELLRAELGGDCGVREVRTAWRYAITGLKTLAETEVLASEILSNQCIETAFRRAFGRADGLPQRFPEPQNTPFELRKVPLKGLSDDVLERFSRREHWFLAVDELRAVEAHFASLGRDPTDLELETIAQTWSEHCVHKTIRSAVDYRGRAFGRAGDAGEQTETSYDNLLQDTIIRATRQLNRPWCLSVFADNAGIVEFDERWGVAFKVETHNHPSALEPYGGAATGVGGCIRDILGCGLGARPVAATDVFCLADPDCPADRVPPGVLHPRRVLRGVVAGVGEYGNRMGIPTVAGGLHFDDRYLANPLVFCGCVGVIPRDRIAKAPRKGDCLVLVGGRTGRDGLGGATFSSAELTDGHADEFAHAVQIGNAIEEKKVRDALLRARDHEGGCLYTSITDCGAGGLSSAVGEMAATLGAGVDLETVPLKYSGLRYNEIWLSEAQERMVLAVPPVNVELLQRTFAEEEVETAVIGQITGDGRLTVRYQGTVVGQLAVGFLHDGRPRRRRTARWDGPAGPAGRSGRPAKEEEIGGAIGGAARAVDTGGGGRPPAAAGAATREDSPPLPRGVLIRATALPELSRTHGKQVGDVRRALLDRLRSLNVCSLESVFRQYDQEVQGGSAIKALTGPGEGPADAAVIRPVLGGRRGLAIGCGLNPQVSDDDPYWMAVQAVDEAIRNVVCVGADADRIALLDNFCWGSCAGEEELGALVRACQGCHDAALDYGTPFISGKDSLNNQFALPGDEARRLGLPPTIVIPGTLLISALGIVDDVERCVSSDLKRPGDRLVYVAADPRRDGPEAAARMHRAVAGAVRGGAVAAAHDVSDGGLAVCLAEMSIGGRRGATIRLDGLAGGDDGSALFAESRSAYVLEVRADADLGELAGASEVVELGCVEADDRLRITRGTQRIAEWTVEELERAWRSSPGVVGALEDRVSG